MYCSLVLDYYGVVDEDGIYIQNFLLYLRCQSCSDRTYYFTFRIVTSDLGIDHFIFTIITPCTAYKLFVSFHIFDVDPCIKSILVVIPLDDSLCDSLMY